MIQAPLSAVSSLRPGCFASPATVLLAAALCGVSTAGHALANIGFEIGTASDSTQVVRLGGQREWASRWSIGQGWIASGFWEGSLGLLRGNGAGGQDLGDISFTPVFRLRSGISRFYLEGAIGAHYFTKTRVNNQRAFGEHLQFGEHIGFGWDFGEKDRYQLGYRFQHISNADMAVPNDGIRLHLIRLGYHY